MVSAVCKVMGVLFIVVAIWGFIAGTQVLVFHVNPAHNAVHLVSGVAALAFAMRGERAAWYFSLVFGVVYGLVALLGFGGTEPVTTALHLNAADNWLHVGIALLFIGTAVAGTMRDGLPERHAAPSSGEPAQTPRHAT